MANLDGLSEQERHDVGLCGNSKFCLPCARENHERANNLEMIRLRKKVTTLFNTLLEHKALLPDDARGKVEDVLKGMQP